MPAAWVLFTIVSNSPRVVQPSLTGQPQLLFITCGRSVGRILAVEIGGSDEELEALGVSGRGAVALIHISATDPLCPRSHSNLVARSTVAHCRAGGVRPVAVIITEGQVVWAARSASRVDAVVPIVIVISSNSIPATVMRFQRIVRPAHAGVLVAYYNPLPSEAHCPDLRGVHILHAPLDARRITRCDLRSNE